MKFFIKKLIDNKEWLPKSVFSAVKIGIVSILPMIISCSNSADNSDFTVNASSAGLLIFLDTSTISCTAKGTGSTTSDVSAVYFNLPHINFVWKKYLTNPLTIRWVNFKVQGAGVSFSTTLGGESLLWSFYGIRTGVDGTGACTSPPCGYDQTNGPSEAIIDGSTSLFATAHPNQAAATSTNECAFTIGGIGISNKKNDLYGSVLITAYATYDAGGNKITPVTAQTTVEFYFKGSGI